MAKTIAFLLLICCNVCLHVTCFSQNAISSDRTCTINVITSQIGVRELTGHNDGPQVQAYLKTVGLGKGYAWCAAFVKYCFVRCAIKSVNKMTGAAASCDRPGYYILSKGRWYNDPLPADVFTLYYNRLGRIGHTGFFINWSNRRMGAYISVEGNTNGGGSRDGDGVYRRIRQIGGTHSINRWVE